MQAQSLVGWGMGPNCTVGHALSASIRQANSQHLLARSLGAFITSVKLIGDLCEGQHFFLERRIKM